MLQARTILFDQRQSGVLLSHKANARGPTNSNWPTTAKSVSQGMPLSDQTYPRLLSANESGRNDHDW